MKKFQRTVRVIALPYSDAARQFHFALAQGIADAAAALCDEHGVSVVALAGGVFQNKLLLHDLSTLLHAMRLGCWVNRAVPPGDGGISLGQAALMLTRV